MLINMKPSQYIAQLKNSYRAFYTEEDAKYWAILSYLDYIEDKPLVVEEGLKTINTICIHEWEDTTGGVFCKKCGIRR